MQVYYSQDIREEELKMRVSQDWFSTFDTAHIVGNIDFCVSFKSDQALFELPSLLWGEAKAGIRHSLYHSLVQLILTIGKAHTFDKHLPPLYLTAFDAAEIAFLPYHTIQSIFYQNDFNWNVLPSDHNSKEFLLLLELVEKTIYRHIIKIEKKLQKSVEILYFIKS